MIDTELPALLKTLCPRVFTDFAPVTTLRPYVTFQLIGGRPLRYVEGAAADKRNSVVQINVWASSRHEANGLARQIEDALCLTAVFSATPDGEIVGDFDADIPVYGCRQDFQILSSR